MDSLLVGAKLLILLLVHSPLYRNFILLFLIWFLLEDYQIFDGVAGFFVFSQQLLIVFFQIQIQKVNDCPLGLEPPPSGARNKRKASMKIRSNPHATIPTRSGSLDIRQNFFIKFFISEIPFILVGKQGLSERKINLTR